MKSNGILFKCAFDPNFTQKQVYVIL